jgi:hypothetical protein
LAVRTVCLVLGVVGILYLISLTQVLHDIEQHSGHSLFTAFSLALVPQTVQTLYLIS